MRTTFNVDHDRALHSNPVIALNRANVKILSDTKPDVPLRSER